VREAARGARIEARLAHLDFLDWFERTYAKWECIHRHEARWDDDGWPYWGGLQMDIDFQRAYGPRFLRHWGTADHWPVWAQLVAAERAYRSRGFGPWPTRRYCG
jgi:hypothetical protein